MIYDDPPERVNSRRRVGNWKNLCRRKPSPLGIGAPLIPLVGASDSIAGRAFFPLRPTSRPYLMERFGGLKDTMTGDRHAVAIALGKFLRRALEALLREEAAARR